jgi:hypothetical protein
VSHIGVHHTKSKLNSSAVYSPSCSHVSVVASSSTSAVSARPSPTKPARLSPALLTLLSTLSLSTIDAPVTGTRFAVADTGATDHMVPDKCCFISYKSVSGLSVRMGNNSFVPVLGRGTAVFELNGKRILVRNVLHVPGLAVPLYSLRTHVTQRGCGFIGSGESGFLVYFPSFVSSTRLWIAICPLPPSAARLRWTLFIMSNRDALLSSTRLIKCDSLPSSSCGRR